MLPFSYPKCPLNFCAFPEVLTAVIICCFPGVTAVIPGCVSSELLVLASQSSGPQDAKSPPITLLVCFHEARQSPGIFPPHDDCRFHVTTRIHVIWGFLHSIHHSAKAVSIWWEKPEYYSILLEFSRAIPQTLWRRWIFNFSSDLEENTVVRIYQGREVLPNGSGKQTKNTLRDPTWGIWNIFHKKSIISLLILLTSGQYWTLDY